MNSTNYNKLVKKICPPEDKFKNMLISFISGGLIGLIGQFLSEFYQNIFSISNKNATSLVIVTLIFIASLCTALGFFDKLVAFFKCGLIIPITGFAHSMTSAALEHKKEGPIYGIGNNIFKMAGSVIMYGVVAAAIFGAIRYIIFGG